MRERTIQITEHDLRRLENLLEASAEQPADRDRGHLDELEEELSRATVVSPEQIPSGVVTMNSRVRIVDLDSGEESVLTLVFPRQADIDAGRISILSPVGTALLGYRVGDTIEWPVPAGRRRIRVEDVLYQPEASGDYHL
ncbi:MAG: nucleoside diphosphate kinase regulator [Deferrisomatales bacterium]|nr:nucleoside diphosphate kinase regulator [Deferrisomatales bacterium]